MTLNKQSDVKNHLSRRTRKNLLPFRPASQPDATNYSENELGRTKVNAPGYGPDFGRQLSSAVVSITPLGVSVSSGRTVATSIVRKSHKRETAFDIPAHRMRAVGRHRSETRAILRKVDVCRRYDGRCSGREDPQRGLALHVGAQDDAHSRFAAGRTAESAIGKAITFALNQVNGRFNAAELNSIDVREFPGFQIAKVTLHARQIQQAASLGFVDDMTSRQAPAQ